MLISLDNFRNHILMERMLPYWTKLGHKVTVGPNDNAAAHLCAVRFGYQSKCPKIQRLDGIIYDLDDSYQERNKSIGDSHHVADAIIYQSVYSKRLIEALLTPRRKTALFEVIYNGIEPNWSGTHKEHDGINIVISGKHRRHKRLQEIIYIFLEYHSTHKDSKLHIFGKLHNNKEVKHSAIIYYGMVSREKMFDVFNVADMSLHLSKRDSCPNSVVECISSGIPVITTDNCGGSTEMCNMTPGCIVIEGDGDPLSTEPVAYYQDPWNKLTNEVKHSILIVMNKISNEKYRVILPKELTAEYTSERYIDLIQRTIDNGK